MPTIVCVTQLDAGEEDEQDGVGAQQGADENVREEAVDADGGVGNPPSSTKVRKMSRTGGSRGFEEDSEGLHEHDQVVTESDPSPHAAELLEDDAEALVKGDHDGCVTAGHAREEEGEAQEPASRVDVPVQL